MLALIGLGLDTDELSLKAMQRLKDADAVFYEEYTANIADGYLAGLSMKLGKELVKLSRTDLEEGAKETVSMAKSQSVAILVPGDPLTATTHHILVEEAKAQGVEVKVFHAPSIFTAAIGESGLDIYKFGPTATIPRFAANYKPTSFIGLIKKNLENSEHTLILFDVDQATGASIPAEEALANLMEAGKGSNVIGMETRILFISEMGRPGQEILYMKAKELQGQVKNRGGLSCMIIPAKTSFAEDAAVAVHPNPST